MGNTLKSPIVLIVDDMPVHTQGLVKALYPDYQVKVVDNGREALWITRHEPQPDIILLDVMMPEMDGFEVYKHIKGNPFTRDIPVIFVTAKNDEYNEEYAINLGAVDYITKPFSIAITKARIRNHIRLKQQADWLKSLSLIDALTGIPNRRHFNQTIKVEWRRAMRELTPLSLLMIDIDCFKNYNDHYGHGAGDRCLHSVASVLQTGVSRPGDLVARYGGEEFVVLLPKTSLKAASNIATRLCECVRNLKLPHAYSDAGPFVTVSIGCATTTLLGEVSVVHALLEEADRLLYQAKNMGRDRVCWN